MMKGNGKNGKGNGKKGGKGGGFSEADWNGMGYHKFVRSLAKGSGV